MTETKELRRVFGALYTAMANTIGTPATPRVFGAPGRVNLIGEHTDYNEGFVLPIAINYATCVAAAARKDSCVRVFSLNHDESVEFDLSQPGDGQRGIWLDYVEGIAQGLRARGFDLVGADLALVSTVPEGAGLSSSAALEVSVGFALLSLAGIGLTEETRKSLALAGQFAEHKYVGTQSGIMDQFISALGRKDHALLIDCRTQDATHVPLDLNDAENEARIVVCDSRVKHELSSSEYNVRRKECEQGVELLREFLPDIESLRDVAPPEFQKYEMKLPEPVRRRCRHVVNENARTLAATESLREKQLAEFGRLMYASHTSLKNDYEVSCAELDTLVAIASGIEGVYGARMTGGGFGGCTVNLVRRDTIEEFQTTITREYERTTRLRPSIYIVEACDGAKEILTEQVSNERIAR